MYIHTFRNIEENNKVIHAEISQYENMWIHDPPQ